LLVPAGAGRTPDGGGLTRAGAGSGDGWAGWLGPDEPGLMMAALLPGRCSDVGGISQVTPARTEYG